MSLNTNENNIAFLNFSNHVLHVKIKEDAELTVETAIELTKAKKDIVQEQPHVEIIDLNDYHLCHATTKEFFAENQLPNQLASALISRNLATKLDATVYIKNYEPNHPTKLFKSTEEGLEWLKSFLAQL